MDTSNHRTFTQDEVNHIVSERLLKERAKFEAEYSAKEQELEKRDILQTARKMIFDRELPSELIFALNCNSMGAMTNSIETIEQLISPTDYEMTTEETKVVRCAMGLPIESEV